MRKNPRIQIVPNGKKIPVFHSEFIGGSYAVTESGAYKFEDGTIYYPHELEALADLTRVDVKTIHQAKKIFNGHLVNERQKESLRIAKERKETRIAAAQNHYSEKIKEGMNKLEAQNETMKIYDVNLGVLL